MPELTVRDKESGRVLTFNWDGAAPPTETDLHAIFQQARGVTTQPTALGENGRPAVSSHLSDAPPSDLMQMLNSAAHPQSLGDFLGLLLPAGGGSGMRSLAGAAQTGGQVLRESVTETPALSKLPLTILQNLTKRAFPPEVTPTALSARLASKAPALTDVLSDALNEARQAPKPTSVSLPGGNTYRAEGTVPSAATARPAPAATPAASGLASAAPETPATAPSTPAPPPGPAADLSPKAAQIAQKLKLTPEEYRAFQGLVQQGRDPGQVLKAIEGQRAALALQQRFQLPTNAEVDAAVADRNATGRWPQDRK